MMNRYLLLTLLLCCSMNNYADNFKPFSLTSSAFTDHGMIPSTFTCDGKQQSPPLVWQNVPANTQSLALVVQDPDAPSGTWTHWIVFNILPTVTQLDTNNIPPEVNIAQNSWGNSKYQGPCPDLGAHSYVFTLYALDRILPFENGVATNTLLDAMTGHVLDSAILTGLYQKAQQ